MKKLAALARALGIVSIAILPGFGAFFTVKSGERPPHAAAPEPQGRLELVGRYEVTNELEGQMRLGFARNVQPVPAGASPALVIR